MPLKTKIVLIVEVLEVRIQLEADFDQKPNYHFTGQTLDLNLPLLDVINGIFSEKVNPVIPPEFNDSLIVKDLFLSYSKNAGFSFVASVLIANQDIRFLVCVNKQGSGYNYAIGLQDNVSGLQNLRFVGNSFKNIEFKNLGIIYSKEPGKFALPELETIDNETTLNFQPERSLIKGFNLSGEIILDDINIALSETDGFISTVVPPIGIDTDTKLIIAEEEEKNNSNTDIGFGRRRPTNLMIGPVGISGYYLIFKFENGEIVLGAAVDIKGSLAVIDFTIENIGLLLPVSMPKDNQGNPNGNAGIFNFGVKYKPPTGIALKINAGVVTGGGYVGFRPEKKEYFGILELTVKDTISLKAIGILNTIMPDGSEGYSLFLLITAEFSPLQLGFGFTLNGVGGLIGVHRTMNLEALRTGVKTGAVDSIMFPDDPLNNAPRIISDLQNIFPVAKGRYAFGLMGILGWGTPSLLELELGLILEVPSPVRLAILGILRAILPDKNKAVLKLQVNFAGTIDFEQKFITFDATLFDSKLLTMTLTGDMAVRIKGGDNPNFVFTVGGWHPQYSPPTSLALPSLNRLTICLLSGNKPRLTIESYFAVTSNTVQFGTRLDFYYKITGKYHCKGWMAFDALFQFSPFYFTTNFSAGLGVYRGSKSLLSLTLSISLEGPKPWHAKGSATFKILLYKGKVKFDKTWGNSDKESLPAKLILPLLEYELGMTSNWSAVRSIGTASNISLRDFTELEDPSVSLENKKLVLYPNDTLKFTQKLIPLGLNIDKIGNQKRADSNSKFDIVLKDKNGKNITGSNTEEQFAPAQFFETKTSKQLGKANFEKHKSGSELKVDGYGNLEFDYLSEREVEYERIIIDNDHRENGGLTILNNALFKTFAASGTAANSKLSVTKNEKSVLAPKKIEFAQQFAVINSLTGESINMPRVEASYENLVQSVQGMVIEQPELEGVLEVIPQHELV